MPKIKFTKSKIDSLKFTDKGRVDYWDTDTKGLGLSVGARTKTFILQMDVKDSTKKSGYRTIKKNLGRYGDDITLEQAREKVRGGVDKETGEAVLGERIKIKLGDSVSAKGCTVTLLELVKAYFLETKRRDGKERRARSAIVYRAAIEQHYAGWMPLTLKEVNTLTPDIVLDKFQQIKAPMAARNASVMLSAVLSYGMAKYPGTLKSNPLAILSSRHVNVMEKIKPRHECLIYDADKRRNDFQTFFNTIQVMGKVRQELLLLTLYTGMRSSEASTLEWGNIDLENGELHIADTKNRQDLNIPLSRQAMAIVTRRKELAQESDKWVFPSDIKCKTGHASMKSDYLKKVTGLDLTIHALRRTFITVGRRLKRYEDTDRLTNHVDSSMAGKHYDETDIEDLRETANMIGNEIERRMLAETAKVIDISTARKAA
ncbi:MAG: tyrosine-type recombinase/integrase [Desulfuromonadaceae bacterium]